jgi:hypothetical protein
MWARAPRDMLAHYSDVVPIQGVHFIAFYGREPVSASSEKKSSKWLRGRSNAAGKIYRIEPLTSDHVAHVESEPFSRDAVVQ